MSRKKKAGNPLRLILLVALVGAALYVNQVVVPATPPLFIPTPTPTRSPDSFLIEARSFCHRRQVRPGRGEPTSRPSNPIQRTSTPISSWPACRCSTASSLRRWRTSRTPSCSTPTTAWRTPCTAGPMGRQGDYLPAQAELDKAIEIDPGNALAYAYQAEILAQQQTEGKGDLTTVDKAIEASRKAAGPGPRPDGDTPRARAGAGNDRQLPGRHHRVRAGGDASTTTWPTCTWPSGATTRPPTSTTRPSTSSTAPSHSHRTTRSPMSRPPSPT